MRGGPMDDADTAKLVAGRGIVGNADQGGTRQVTIIDQQRWTELMAQVDADADACSRRANLMVSGVSLDHSRGRVLRIGGCRLAINGETRPCGQMEAVTPGLRAAMRDRWGGGVFAEVLDDGEIAVGDAVDFAE